MENECETVSGIVEWYHGLIENFSSFSAVVFHFLSVSSFSSEFLSSSSKDTTRIS